MPVSFLRHPLGAREVALEGPPSPIRLAFRVNMQNDPGHLTPIGTFRISIKHADIRDCVFFVVDGERWAGGRQIGDIRIKGWACSR